MGFLKLVDRVLNPGRTEVLEARIGLDLETMSLHSAWVAGEVRTRPVIDMDAKRYRGMLMTLSALMLARAWVLEKQPRQALVACVDEWAARVESGDQNSRLKQCVLDVTTFMGIVSIVAWPVKPLDPLQHRPRIWGAALRAQASGYSLWLDLTAGASMAFVPAAALLLIDHTIGIIEEAAEPPLVLALLLKAINEFCRRSTMPHRAGTFDSAACAWAWKVLESATEMGRGAEDLPPSGGRDD